MTCRVDNLSTNYGAEKRKTAMNAEDFTNDKTLCKEYKLSRDNIACSLHHPNGTRVGREMLHITALPVRIRGCLIRGSG